MSARTQHKKEQLQRKLAARKAEKARAEVKNWLTNGSLAIFFFRDEYVFHFHVIDNTPVLGDICREDKRAYSIFQRFCAGSGMSWIDLMNKIVQGMWNPQEMTEPAKISVLDGGPESADNTLLFDEMMYKVGTTATIHKVGYFMAETTLDMELIAEQKIEKK